MDPYFSHFDNVNEHVNYKSAESRLENIHRLRMSKVMKDWGELERKYQEMRSQKGLEDEAEEFKRTVTIRFQKTIKNLEDEADAEKKQLQAVHQQRVSCCCCCLDNIFFFVQIDCLIIFFYLLFAKWPCIEKKNLPPCTRS